MIKNRNAPGNTGTLVAADQGGKGSCSNPSLFS